ncbi:MAG: AsmA-like C-terminal region-containing protein [Chitinispirillaceae bacterium]
MKFERKVTVLLLSASILTLMGFIPFRVTFLEEKASRMIRDAGADSIRIERISVRLWQGICISGVDLVENFEGAEKYRISADKFEISCNLAFAALHFAFSGDESVTEKDLFGEMINNPLDVIKRSTRIMKKIKPCKSVSVRGGSVDIFEDQQRTFYVRKTSLELKRGGDGLKGDVGFAEAFLPSLAVVRKFRAELSVDEDLVAVRNGKGDLFNGKLKVDTGLDLDSSDLIPSIIEVKGLELERFCSQTDFSLGSLKGTLDLKADIERSDIHVDSLKGKGEFDMKNVEASDLPIQKTATVNFVSTKLQNLYFRKVESLCTISNGRLRFKNFRGYGDKMDFSAQGWIRPDGRMNLKMNGVFSKNFSKKLKRLVKVSLEKTEEGKTEFRCRISGTFEHPLIEIDGSVYKRAAGSVLGDVKQGLRSIFK